MENNVVIGGLYEHYKKQRYKVLGTARHSETMEDVVIYECLYPNSLGQIWVRPKAMFCETVSIGEYTGPRFKLVEE